MRYISLDEGCKGCLLIRKGETTASFPALSMLSSGSIYNLPDKDLERLANDVKAAHRLIPIRGVAGRLRFVPDVPGLNHQDFTKVLYLILVGMCPIFFLGYFAIPFPQWLHAYFGEAMVFSGLSLVFPWMTGVQDVMTEMQGWKAARSFLLKVVLGLLVLAAALQVLTWVPYSLSDPISDGFPIDSEAIFHTLIDPLPIMFVRLALMLSLTQGINLLLFDSVRRFSILRPFWLRSLISSSLAQIIFTWVGCFIVFGAWWQQKELPVVMTATLAKLLFVIPVTAVMAVVMVKIYQPHQARKVREFLKQTVAECRE